MKPKNKSKIVAASFLILVVLMILILNREYYDSVIEKKLVFDQNQQLRDYIAEKGKIDYLFMGDSHTHVAINPEFFPGSFNLAFSSNSYIDNYYKLKNLVDYQQVKIKYLLLEADPHSFSSYMLEHSPLRYDTWFYIRFVPAAEIAAINNETIPQTYVRAYLPFLGRGEDLLVHKQSFQKSGWLKQDANLSQKDIAFETRHRVTEQFEKKARIDPLLYQYYIKILKLAKQNGIQIIIIRYPLSDAYNKELQTRNITETEYYNILLNATSNILPRYNLLDYHSLFLEKDSYFSDPDHLNYKGAEILSRRVYRDLTESAVPLREP